MKKRKTFLENMAELYSTNSKKYYSIFVILCIGIFVITTFFSSTFIVKVLTEEEVEYYKEVAVDVYNQGSAAIYEVPDGIDIEKTDITITVSSKNEWQFGKVVARLQNGQLVFKHTSEIFVANFLNVCIGVVPTLIGILFCLAFHDSLKKSYLRS